jgi:transcription antitermination factor NusG
MNSTKSDKIDHLDPQKPRWFAMYTKPRAEKKVFAELERMQIEAYLPLRKELRQWSDRKKWVEFPLFPSYVFARLTTKTYYEIPKFVDGFLCYVIIRGNRIAVRDEEIETIRLMLEECPTEIDLIDANFEIGDRVKITGGLLMGKTAELVDYKGKQRVAIRLETLDTKLALVIDKRYLELIDKKNT